MTDGRSKLQLRAMEVPLAYLAEWFGTDVHGDEEYIRKVFWSKNQNLTKNDLKKR